MIEMEIMLDIETLGRADSAVVVSIGAVAFDWDGMVHPDYFYEVLDRAEQVQKGRSVDPGTIDWWMKQGEGARKVLSEPVRPVGHVLRAFHDWVKEFGEKGIGGVWGNGSDFDNRILTNLYDCILPEYDLCPWQYSQNRCYRTLKNLRPDVGTQSVASMLASFGKHHAAYDAEMQARHAIAIMRKLNESGTVTHGASQGKSLLLTTDEERQTLEAVATLGDSKLCSRCGQEAGVDRKLFAFKIFCPACFPKENA